MTGVPQAIASIITRPKGSGQSIGNRRARALPRNSLLPLVDLSDELYAFMGGDLGGDCFGPVRLVDLVDFGGNLQIARSGRFSGEMRPRKAR